MEGSRYGLYMHCKGDKGPTVLTRKSDVSELDKFLNSFELVPGVQVNVVDEVKFLGVQIKICGNFNCVVASLPSDVTKTLSFFTSELNRNVRILSSNTNYESLQKQFQAFSLAGNRSGSSASKNASKNVQVLCKICMIFWMIYCPSPTENCT